MKKRESRGRFLIICSALLFTIILFADFYAAVNFPENYAFIAAFMAVDVLCLFGTIYGILIVKEEKEIRREEQYDSIFKSEKASYLMLRKYFDEITEALARVESASKNQDQKIDIPLDEIVGAQKAAAKVIISRSKENADAILMSADNIGEEIDALKEYIASETAKTAESQKKANEDQIKEMIIALKDMELRVNAAILQCQNAVSQIPSQIPTPQPMPMNIMPQMAAPIMQAPVMQAPVVEPPVAETPVVPAPQPAPVAEPSIDEDLSLDDELMAEEAVAEEVAIDDISVDDISVDDISVDDITADDISIDDITADDISIDETMSEEPSIEDLLAEEPVTEEEPLIEAVVEEEPVVEEAPADLPPMPDLSDPNAKMNPDDIAALIANMSANPDVVESEEPVTEEEPLIEAVVEEEPVVEEAPADLPPMPDLSDPNAKMNPDDIAALIANMSANPDVVENEEPVAEEEPLIEAVEETPIEEAPVEEAPAEEIPPMPDLSDPNKVMTPEEIAALIANI